MLQPEEKEFLKTAKPLQYLEAYELNMLIEYSEVVHFKPGEHLLQQGKTSDRMFIIISGTAIVSAHVLGKGFISLNQLDPGDFIGEVSLIEQVAASITVTATTPLVSLQITEKYLDMLSIFFPKMRFHIIKAISEVVYVRLQRMHNKISTILTESDFVPSEITFTEIMHSLTGPREISFESAHFDSEQLKTIDFFKKFSYEERELLLQQIKIIKTPAHVHLISMDEINVPFYFILFGAVQANIVVKNKIAKLTILGPNSFFSLTTSICQQPSFVVYQSRENAILLEIPLAAFNALKKDHPTIEYKFYDIFCQFIIILERAANRLFLRLNSELYNR